MSPKSVNADRGTIPPLSSRANELLVELEEFMRTEVYPNEARFEAELKAQPTRFGYIPPVMEELKAKAKARGLWNLFLPEWSGISNRDYATLAEQMGRNLWAAEVFNCQFPDTGNMETLQLYANAGQKAKFLEPIKEGKVRSAFVMTEPGVASSDAVQLKTALKVCCGPFCPLVFFAMSPR
jgi:acyl-CoA dehydrogenase